MSLTQDATNDQVILVGTVGDRNIAETFADFATANARKKAYEASGNADLHLSFLPKAIHVS
jgi:hypothetical protein